MKMKNHMAFVFIGLLVITGCKNLFEPPAATTTDGTGTLYVSINGAESRTILPAEKLDKYVLTVTDNGTFEEDFFSTGSTGIVLPAATYDLLVRGYVVVDDVDVLVAEEIATDIEVAAGGTAQISILLNPANTTGTQFGDTGTFKWDFDGVSIDSLTIEIYDINDENAVTDLLNDNVDLTSSIELDAGIYDVKFTVEVGGEIYTWREVLYLYVGLTSAYGAADFATSDVGLTILYRVPTDGPGYFYLDLNDWKRQTPPVINYYSTVSEGTTAENSLTVMFTENFQLLSIKLSAEQAALMMASDYITVTIDGTAEPENRSFRFFLGNPFIESPWSATNTNQGTFSDIVGSPIRTDFNYSKSAARVGYFILQFQEYGPTEVTINSIRIDYTLTLPCECSGCALENLTAVQAKVAWLFCTCDPCSGCDICTEVGPVPFDITALTGITLYAGGDYAPVLSDGDTVATVTASSDSSLFWFTFADAGYTFDVYDTITIEYAAIVWPGDIAACNIIDDYNVNIRFEQFTTTQRGTITVYAGWLENVSDTGITFMHNFDDSTNAKYQVKILSVTGSHW